MIDVKELIPQFYDGDGSFLLNKMSMMNSFFFEYFFIPSKFSLDLNFGKRSDGKEVHDVKIPNWANSPKHFIETLRAALESEYVSENLHNWIDLVFGYKQIGVEAEKAFNKFYYLTYEGAVNIEAITNKEELKSIQMQINEYVCIIHTAYYYLF